MTARPTYSISARMGFALLILSFAAVAYLLSQLHASFATNVLIAMLTGWALVIVYATGAMKHSIARLLNARSQRKAEKKIEKEVQLKAKRIRKQKLKPMKRVTLSNGHIVKVA